MMTKKEYIQPTICKYDLQGDALMDILPASGEGAGNGEGEDDYAPSFGGLDDDYNE